MTQQTFLQEVATLRDFLALLEADPSDELHALNVEQAAKSVVWCARRLIYAPLSPGPGWQLNAQGVWEESLV